MHSIGLFAEDVGHEAFLRPLIERLAASHGVDIILRTYSARGGRGKVITELGQFAKHIRAGDVDMPDALVVAIDANCKGYAERKDQIDAALGDLSSLAVYAVPDPHIERWMLLDASAFKTVLGKGCAAPDRKCEQDRYKRILVECIRDAGRSPLVGGMEFAKSIVEQMKIEDVARIDDSFSKLAAGLKAKFSEWRRSRSK